MSFEEAVNGIVSRLDAWTPDEWQQHNRRVDGELARVADLRRRSAERARRQRKAEIPARYREATWASYETPTPAHLEARNRARAWNGSTWCLLLYGGPGSGKTHLATAALRDLEAAGVGAAWRESSRTLREIQAGFEDGSSWRVEQALRRVEVLLLDDLGAERVTEWARETLSSILRERYDDQRRTIITTNLNREELTRWDPRLADRVWSPASTVVRVAVSSWRQRR